MTFDIESMSEIELIELNHKIVQRIKYLRNKRTLSRMFEFNIGEKVSFHPKGHGPLFGTVAKLNKKTVTVVTEDGEHWNVAPVYLKKPVTPVSTGSERSNVIQLKIKPKQHFKQEHK